MDARPTTADSKHLYPPQLWIRSISSPAVPKLTNQTSTLSVTSRIEPLHSPFPSHVDLLPILLPQQSSLYQAQLLQYNKLVALGRGRGGGLQSPPLPPLLSTSNIHIRPQPRSSPKVSNKDSSRARPGTQNCHGNKGSHNTNRGDRALITGRESSSVAKMAPQKKTQASSSHMLPPRPGATLTTSNDATSGSQQAHPNSVPSTPHQRARNFSFGSREPSPNPNTGHSPRSAYSETNSNLPSLRPLPPRNGGCRYEVIPERSRRRMPYSLGSDRLEKSDLTKVKAELAKDDEKKLTSDMRELYDRLKPTDAIEDKRRKLVVKLEKLLNDTWPGHEISVRLFGSSGNLLCSDDSDVDICITTPWKELEGVCMLADVLAKHGMEKVVCVSSAKVPIVKIWDPELGLACDMNVNNTLALENTRMIRTYVQIDKRVRPLAMILKYWTRRRIVNDAAFGGTLSSYTWICMIIAFLQLRQPPVLPALHQKPHLKSTKKDDDIAAFADDLDRLRGFGDKNKATLGQLLFEFFRFYAHEFDFSEWALSIRLGKLMKKTDKKHWRLATNNSLCVEEPFNTMRNLGNTADDTSFRGIHLELRRAFDLIAEGKLEECCEQYVFPKEEERPIFQRPVASRPVLLRSASQQNNRGSRNRNNRQQGQYRNHNHSNNNRRASSNAVYNDAANQMYYPGYAFMNPPDGMYMPPEVIAQTLTALQMQENSLRFMQYTQNQALAQQQALAHQQRMQGNISQPQSTERSRTNSFDNPPLTAPLRPDMAYSYWPYPQTPAYYGHPGFTTYPSSPSNGPTAEHRRTSHRSGTVSEAGGTTSGSSLRSQSQPASRPVSAAQAASGYANTGSTNGITSIPARHVNGIPIPSFMPDENSDNDHEVATSITPPEDERYNSYYLEAATAGSRPVGASSAMPAFGDMGPQDALQDRRRLSSDQFNQVLDRIKRTSRSPSPLGHNRAYSVGISSAPLASAPFPANTRPVQDTKPVVVNGSVHKAANTGPSRQAPGSEGAAPTDASYDNPLHISQASNESSSPSGSLVHPSTPARSDTAVSDRPLVVNGSSAATTPVLNQFAPRTAGEVGIAVSQVGPHMMPMSPQTQDYIARNSPTAFQRFFPRQTPSPLIAQLDLATDHGQPDELQHLSPVYETRTPSPTVTRKFDLPAAHPPARKGVPGSSKDPKQDTSKSKLKAAADAPAAPTTNTKANGTSRENGHTRGAKSESDTSGGGTWQKISNKGRKKGADGKGKIDSYPQSEQLPKNDSERKGG